MSATLQTSMAEQDIKVFIDAIGGFFTPLAEERPEIRTAYLSQAQHALPNHDYTGIIHVSGAYEGTVSFSAPRSMLRRVLMCMNEPSLTEENFLDATGEIANIFSGNARRHFGETLEISPPSLHAGPLRRRGEHRNRPFVIEIEWSGYPASVVVDLARN